MFNVAFIAREFNYCLVLVAFTYKYFLSPINYLTNQSSDKDYQSYTAARELIFANTCVKAVKKFVNIIIHNKHAPHFSNVQSIRCILAALWQVIW